MPISKGIRVIVKRFLRVWRKENSSRHIVDRGEFLQSDSQPLSSWIKSQIESEKYWFHAIELPGGMVTPGWSNPRTDKLPFFGLPDEMHGLRVLDIGHAEGFFSFEAERRGAAEVVGGLGLRGRRREEERPERTLVDVRRRPKLAGRGRALACLPRGQARGRHAESAGGLLER